MDSLESHDAFKLAVTFDKRFIGNSTRQGKTSLVSSRVLLYMIEMYTMMMEFDHMSSLSETG